MKRKHIITDDGSSTIFIEEMDEHYHSFHGALQEANHVFISNGFDFMTKDQLLIFEMGFGTGLNALLTLQKAMTSQKVVHYTSIEAFPVEMKLVNELNYKGVNGEEDVFLQLHDCRWNEKVAVNENFFLEKIDQKIQQYNPQLNQYDLIYFDAFGYRAQPELWDITVLRKMYDMLVGGGVLVTYAARGQFKRDLKSLGFEVQSLPGPPGKREMTRAIKG